MVQMTPNDTHYFFLYGSSKIVSNNYNKKLTIPSIKICSNVHCHSNYNAEQVRAVRNFHISLQ